MRKTRSGILIACFIHLGIAAFSQDSLQHKHSGKLYSKYTEDIRKKSDRLQSKLNAKTTKAFNRFKKKEEKLFRKVYASDSLKLKEFSNSFAAFEQKIAQPQQLSQYIPNLDTLITSTKFLEQNQLVNKDQIEAAANELRDLSSEFQKAELVKQFINERRKSLIDRLNGSGFSKELKQLNKEVYYYAEQIKEYKQLLKDRKKIERKVIESLTKTKVFRDFMKKNSLLASLFRMPSSDPSDPAYAAALSGLQTRNQVQQLIRDQAGIGGSSASNQISQNVQQAQTELQQLKSKLEKGGGSGNDIMPEGFKPNHQKKKSFLERIELGTNLQTSRGSTFFPVTSDLGFSIGYKLNDKSVIGIGSSYKLGLGSGWNNISFSSQGIGLRSFIDWKIKGSFWVSGGYEQNYREEIRRIEQLRDHSAWQKSGLLGMSKVISTKSKFFKKTKLQVLWDFLSYEQVPRTQPLVFRFGYNFK